jgi:hypothetical protein
MGSSTGVAFYQLHPQPQEVLANGLEAPGAANYVAASPVSWPGPPRRRENRLPASPAVREDIPEDHVRNSGIPNII